MSTIVPPTGDRQTDNAGLPFLICPNCGSVPSSIAQRFERGTITSDAACPKGHIWSVRWLDAA